MSAHFETVSADLCSAYYAIPGECIAEYQDEPMDSHAFFIGDVGNGQEVVIEGEIDELERIVKRLDSFIHVMRAPDTGSER